MLQITCIRERTLTNVMRPKKCREYDRKVWVKKTWFISGAFVF